MTRVLGEVASVHLPGGTPGPGRTHPGLHW